MKPAWKPIKVNLGQIKAWDKNPRMSTKAQAQRIIASERKFGQPVPFLISPDFLLYDGHQRLAAWFTVYGADYEMDAMQSDRPLSEDEHKELVITLHTGATGSWNWDALSGWSAGDLQEWGMNGDALKSWNNDANNLKELLNADNVKPVDADPQIDRAAELAEKWHTKSGQLWKLGEHRLLIGDCTVRENVERLMGGERADMVFTDPPYNVKYSGRGQSTSHEIENDDMPDEDFYAWLLSVCKLINEFTVNSAPYYLCHGDTGNKALPFMNVFKDYNWKRSSTIIWVKNAASMGWQDYRSQHECISYGWKDNGKHYFTESRSETTIWDISRDAQYTYDHPTQKPVALPSKAIQNSSVSGALLYEPFAGSGTTIIAAHNLNRRCYAMEISEKYGAVILERFFTATGIMPELVE